MSAAMIQLIGGDLRQLALASRLADAGYSVSVCGISPDLPVISRYFPHLRERICANPCSFSPAAVCILPLPVSEDQLTVHCPLSRCPESPLRLSVLLEALPPDCLLLGGRVSAFLHRLALEENHSLIDYYEAENIQIRNSVPTAEGAIQLAMQELPITIAGARCTVLGFGRVGKTLALTLRNLGAAVTVAARSISDRSWAVSWGCRAAELCEYLRQPAEADVIFNTIPVCLMDAPFLAKLESRPTIIELASVSGCDRAAAAQCGIPVVEGRSLPGRVAPITAGTILADAILELLRKEGI